MNMQNKNKKSTKRNRLHKKNKSIKRNTQEKTTETTSNLPRLEI